MGELQGKAHVKSGDAQETICLYETLADVQNQGLCGSVNGHKGYMQYGFLNDPKASRARLRLGGMEYALLKERLEGAFAPAGMLRVSAAKTRKGADMDNLREIYMPAEDLAYRDVYTHPVSGKKVKGEWSYDESNPYVPEAICESMYGCVKGMVRFTFTGRSVFARLLLDWE